MQPVLGTLDHDLCGRKDEVPCMQVPALFRPGNSNDRVVVGPSSSQTESSEDELPSTQSSMVHKNPINEPPVPPATEPQSIGLAANDASYTVTPSPAGIAELGLKKETRIHSSRLELDRAAMPPPPPMPHRVKIPSEDILLWNLICAYGLQTYLRVAAPVPATYQDLISYHDEEYIDILRKASEKQDGSSPSSLEDYGLIDDCSVFRGLWEYCQYIVGGVLSAVKELLSRRTDTAICWAGGRHHAKKALASGYCYVNDIVLGILALQHGGMRRVLYIDLDVHHGDGVEEAFYYSSSVYTVSFHKYNEMFFPGTGSMDRIGKGKGKYRNLNVPLPDGINDDDFFTVFKTTVEKVLSIFPPDAIVLQCGADALSRDPIGTFNLTSASYSKCMVLIKAQAKPLLVLGGGGYHRADVVRCWTVLTALAAQRGAPQCLIDSIPDHGSILEYAPDFSLRPGASCSRGLNYEKNNDQGQVQELCTRVVEVIERGRAS